MVGEGGGWDRSDSCLLSVPRDSLRRAAAILRTSGGEPLTFGLPSPSSGARHQRAPRLTCGIVTHRFTNLPPNDLPTLPPTVAPYEFDQRTRFCLGRQERLGVQARPAAVPAPDPTTAGAVPAPAARAPAAGHGPMEGAHRIHRRRRGSTDPGTDGITDRITDRYLRF